MPRAVIFTSYLDDPLEISPLLQPDDYIVCLDGGYDIAMAQGISPDLMLGDFDSIEAELPDAAGPESAGAGMQAEAADPDAPGAARKRGLPEIRRWPPEKDYTDMELAYRELDPAEYPELLVIGGMGGRLDHTLANIQMLAAYTGPGGFRKIEMMDGRNRCFILRGDEQKTVHRIRGGGDLYLSLIPLFDDCEGLTARGVKYPLEDGALMRGASLGISNEFTEDTAQIQLRRGTLLVVLAKKEKTK